MAYKNPVISPSERKEILLSPEILTQFIGSYTLTPQNIYYTTQTSTLMIRAEDNHLSAKIATQSKIKLFSESETKFFSKIPDVQIEFLKDKKGNIVRLDLYQDGDHSTGVKTL